MKYVMIDENNKVCSDVMNLLDSKVADGYLETFVSVESIIPAPSIGDTYNPETNTWSAATPRQLSAVESRDIRDARLKSSDWIILSVAEGAFEGDANFDLEEWKAYRRALRNLELPPAAGTIAYTSDLFPVRPMYPLYRNRE